MLDFVEQYGKFDIQSREVGECQNHNGEREIVVRGIFHRSLFPALSRFYPDFNPLTSNCRA